MLKKNANYPHFLQAFLLKIEIYALRHIPRKRKRESGREMEEGWEREESEEGKLKLIPAISLSSVTADSISVPVPRPLLATSSVFIDKLWAILILLLENLNLKRPSQA